jgi:hypothetical protein
VSNNRSTINLVVPASFLVLLLICPLFPVLAQPAYNPPDGADEIRSEDTVMLANPLGPVTNLNIVIGLLIRSLLGIIGSIALVVFIYGGFTMMTAAGNPERVRRGQATLVWAIIGLAVIFSAYALARLVLETFTT